MKLRSSTYRWLTAVVLIGCLLLSFQAVSFADAPGEKNIVEVSTVDAFLAAIAPNTEIRLAPGDYNLSQARDYGSYRSGEYYSWESVYDGYELVIVGIQNFSVVGENVSISAVPRYANVLTFRSCNTIALEGITAGHVEAPGNCSGGVFRLDYCENVSIHACHMFGCGIYGVEAYSTSNLTVTDSEIYDCQFGAVSLNNCRAVLFDSCSVHDCPDKWDFNTLLTVSSSRNVTFANSTFVDNNTQVLLDNWYSQNVFFVGNEVQHNRVKVSMFQLRQNGVTIDGCSFSENDCPGYLEDGVPPVNLAGTELDAADIQSMQHRDVDVSALWNMDTASAVSVEPGEDGSYHVSTTDEFLAALGPDRTIVLEAQFYDLSQASDYGGYGSAHYYWEDCYDGFALIITNVEGLRIVSSDQEAELHTIAAQPRYANVLTFQNCRNVLLSGFTAGHTEIPGECSGGVLYFTGCMDVTVDSCRMYGCGTMGIQAYDCSMIKVCSSSIFDCSYGGVSFWNVSEVRMENCSIYDVPSPGISVNECYDVMWNNLCIGNGMYDVNGEGLVPFVYDYDYGYGYETYDDSASLALSSFSGKVEAIYPEYIMLSNSSGTMTFLLDADTYVISYPEVGQGAAVIYFYAYAEGAPYASVLFVLDE